MIDNVMNVGLLNSKAQVGVNICLFHFQPLSHQRHNFTQILYLVLMQICRRVFGGTSSKYRRLAQSSSLFEEAGLSENGLNLMMLGRLRRFQIA
jgi:hypothetical protein